MSRPSEADRPAPLSPQAAIAALGDETRLGVLRTLGEAAEPLSFSELHRLSDCESSANFSYHLDQLRGHFIHQTEAGYVLRQAGRRVIEAVFAEAVPGTTGFGRSPVDWPCFRCGSPVEVSFREGHVGLYCAACGGTRDRGSATGDGRLIDRDHVLGILDLPPAGAVDRTPQEVLEAAHHWTNLEVLALARELCPRCSGALEVTVDACADHPDTGEVCDVCDQRFAITLWYACGTCLFSVRSPIGTYLFDDPALRSFMLDHGIDPLDSPGFHFETLTETLHSVEPFEAELTFTVDGDSLRFAVDDDLSVRLIGTDRGPEAR